MNIRRGLDARAHRVPIGNLMFDELGQNLHRHPLVIHLAGERLPIAGQAGAEVF